MIFRLVEPTINLEKQYIDFICEWEMSKEKIIPWAVARGGMSYSEFLNKLEFYKSDEVYKIDFVPATLFFMVDENNKIYGALHFRHVLNENLRKSGGHIGYGIRQSERRHGYAKKMLSLGLNIAKNYGIDKVLLTCNKDNIGSAKTIMHNGGKLKNEIIDDGTIIQRYWIDLSNCN